MPPAGGHSRPGMSGRPAWWAGVAAVMVVAALLGAAAPLRFGIPVYQLLVDASRPLFGVGYGLLLAAAIAASPWRSRIAVGLGTASYGIYLLHPLILEVLQRTALVPVPDDTLPAFAVHVIVLMALTIPLALASWRWLERPLLRAASSPSASTIRARAAAGDPPLLE